MNEIIPEMIAACHALVFFNLNFPDKLSNSFIQHIYIQAIYSIYIKKLFFMKFKLLFNDILYFHV